MSMLTRAFKWLYHLRTALLIGLTVGFLLNARLEPPWLSYRNLPFPVKQPVVVAGTRVPLVVERCNATREKQKYSTTRRFVSDDPVVAKRHDPVLLGGVEVGIDPGCHRSLSVISETPSNLKPGLWHLEGDATIKVWFWTTEVPWYSETFEVIAP